ncbi:MAG: hypothetical protein ACOC1I_08630, partial [Spirochaetota bacterium]
GLRFDSLDETVTESLISAGNANASPAVARAFWRALASSGSSRAPQARRALVELSLEHGGAGELAEALVLLDEAGEAGPDELARGALVLADAGSQEAVPILARAVRGDRAGGEATRLVFASGDETLYELARFLERPGDQRDLRRSAAIYEHIVDDRPLSARWDDSRERLEFLQRHYFDVR